MRLPPAPVRRRSTTVEVVEGDDDVLNIDRRSMLTYLLAAFAFVVAAGIGVVGYRALRTPSHPVPQLVGMTEAEASTTRQVITPHTADLMTSMMRGVVCEGTGVKAQVEGMPIPSKWGRSGAGCRL